MKEGLRALMGVQWSSETKPLTQAEMPHPGGDLMWSGGQKSGKVLTDRGSTNSPGGFTNCWARFWQQLVEMLPPMTSQTKEIRPEQPQNLYDSSQMRSSLKLKRVWHLRGGFWCEWCYSSHGQDQRFKGRIKKRNKTAVWSKPLLKMMKMAEIET